MCISLHMKNIFTCIIYRECRSYRNLPFCYSCIYLIKLCPTELHWMQSGEKETFYSRCGIKSSENLNRFELDLVCWKRNWASNGLWWRAVRGTRAGVESCCLSGSSGQSSDSWRQRHQRHRFYNYRGVLVRVTWHALEWFLISRVPVCLPHFAVPLTSISTETRVQL